jgi:ribosomal protein L11 methyltransferase
MPRSWLLLRLTIPRDQAERFQRLLADLGTLGVEERPAGGEAWRVSQPWDQAPSTPHEPAALELLAYFDRSANEQQWVDRVEHALSSIPGATLGVGTMEEGDWEERWRSTFQPLLVTAGVVIAPPWDPQPGALLIEPGAAFGTGQHPTTLACLQAVARHARPGESMLDVGCGTGVLALLGASLGMRAYGIDCDLQAVQAARDNARRNDLPCRFDDRSLRQVPGRYDLVVANIFAEELVRLSSDLCRLTGGRLVLAGILADRVHLVEQAMRPLAPARRRVDGDWVSLELVRP